MVQVSWTLLARGILLMLCAACAEPEQTVPVRQPTPLDLSTAGVISGVVRFSGPAPEQKVAQLGGWSECAAQHPDGLPKAGDILVQDGKLANAMVYIKKGLGERVFAIPEEPVIIDQRGCLFIPRIAAAQSFQAVRFLNGDPTAHNVHGVPGNSPPWNFSLSVKGSSRTIRVPRPEAVIEIVCDIHGWMKAYLGVFDHPYFALSATDGHFTLEQVPPGDYEIEAWHERFGTRAQTLSLSGGETQTVEFILGAG